MTQALPDCPALEQALVDFIGQARYAQMPAEVLHGVGVLLRDQLALQVGSSRLPWSRQVLALAARRAAPGRCRVVASGRAMDPIDAAFVNATYGHGFEYDDAHRASASHPGSCVVPAALALGEDAGATLGDVVCALWVGYEVYTRIGCLAAPDLLKRGFHPHAVLSTFGAAAVMAQLKRFDAEATLHALAIALSHASGTTEYSSSGGSIKRVHSGIGTRNGLLAAEMAEAGLTGPRAFLSGSKGFFRTFLQRPVSDDAPRWFAADAPAQVERVWLKPYCCCGCNHAFVDVMRGFAGREAEIARIEARIQRSANVVVGLANVHALQPRTIEHVQYSLPVQMAFALLGLGNGMQVHHDYLEGRLDMARVLEVAGRIRLTEAPELDDRYPGKFVADVTVHFRSGAAQHVFVADSFGTPEHPLPPDGQDAKFRELTEPVLGASRAAALLACLKTMDPSMPVADLMALCDA